MLGLGRRNFLAIPNTEKLTQEKRHFPMTAQLTWNHGFKEEKGIKLHPDGQFNLLSLLLLQWNRQLKGTTQQKQEQHCGDLAQSGYRTLGLHKAAAEAVLVHICVTQAAALSHWTHTYLIVYRLLWGLPGCQKLWEECLQTRKINDIQDSFIIL